MTIEALKCHEEGCDELAVEGDRYCQEHAQLDEQRAWQYIEALDGGMDES